MSLLDPKEREQVTVLFISVDPKRDTPEIAHKYASYFGKNFIGVTGDDERLKEITKKYMAFYRIVEEDKKDSNEYLVDHTAYIYLIDKKGTLSLIYSSSKQKPDLIADDIRKIL
jgi:protein SCO1/2